MHFVQMPRLEFAWLQTYFILIVLVKQFVEVEDFLIDFRKRSPKTDFVVNCDHNFIVYLEVNVQGEMVTNRVFPLGDWDEIN